MVYWIVYFATKLLSFLYFPLRIQGRENIPRTGAFLLACNHVSYLDPMVMGIATGRRMNFMAKEELFRKPVLGFVLVRLWAFPVKRNTADRGALKESLARLKRGLPLLMFPEGTRHGAPGEKKIESGIGFLAIKANVPVIPVYIEDSQKVLPPGAKFLHRHAVKVRYGIPKKFPQDSDYDQVARQVMESVWVLKSQGF
ncbi:MAG: 1-acyl-sn-glycerol-3-phosphate acyltransferase [Candidatus Omnitrophica bacterium]|nr:1-acyl-sn-glycerol-3-phosphate acyltransferase [Candidatus Omnitrophota bacterium]